MARYPYPYPFQSDKEPQRSDWGWAIAVMLLLLVVVVILYAPRDLAAPADQAVSTAVSDASHNPELSAFHRYPAARRMQLYLARNPELAAADRYARERMQLDTAVWRHQVPFDRFYDSVEPSSVRMRSDFLARNPEIALFESYQAARR